MKTGQPDLFAPSPEDERKSKLRLDRPRLEASVTRLLRDLGELAHEVAAGRMDPWKARRTLLGGVIGVIVEAGGRLPQDMETPALLESPLAGQALGGISGDALACLGMPLLRAGHPFEPVAGLPAQEEVREESIFFPLRSICEDYGRLVGDDLGMAFYEVVRSAGLHAGGTLTRAMLRDQLERRLAARGIPREMAREPLELVTALRARRPLRAGTLVCPACGVQVTGGRCAIAWHNLRADFAPVPLEWDTDMQVLPGSDAHRSHLGPAPHEDRLIATVARLGRADEQVVAYPDYDRQGDVALPGLGLFFDAKTFAPDEDAMRFAQNACAPLQGKTGQQVIVIPDEMKHRLEDLNMAETARAGAAKGRRPIPVIAIGGLAEFIENRRRKT